MKLFLFFLGLIRGHSFDADTEKTLMDIIKENYNKVYDPTRERIAIENKNNSRSIQILISVKFYILIIGMQM